MTTTFKIILSLCLFLLYISYFFASGYFERGESIKRLELEKKSLYEDIKRRDDSDMEKNRRKEAAKKAVSEDKSNFDWSYDISHSPVIKQLQKSCKSCAD